MNVILDAGLPHWLSDWASSREWSLYPFIPGVVTFASQLITLRLATSLEAKIDGVLTGASLEDPALSHIKRLPKDYSVRLQWSGSLLPMIAVLTVTLLSLPNRNDVGVTVIYGAWALIAVLGLAVAVPDAGALASEFAGPETAWHRKIGVRSFAHILSLAYSVATLGILTAIAILQLPVEAP